MRIDIHSYLNIWWNVQLKPSVPGPFFEGNHYLLYIYKYIYIHILDFLFISESVFVLCGFM